MPIARSNNRSRILCICTVSVSELSKPKCYNPRHPERTLLYQTVAEHYETWLELASAGQFDWQGDHHSPKPYVRKAFEKYLECGIFAHGFARARCDDCGHDFLVAFSCKGRGVCPSCNTRRMAQTAAHLCDHVFPRLPVRQWVLSVPKRLRYFMQRDGAVLGMAVSVNAICAMAQVSKPSLYRDFGSEDGLTLAALTHYQETVLPPLEALMQKAPTLSATLDALVAFASDDPHMSKGCLFVKMRATRSRFGPKTQALLTAIEAGLQSQFTRLFKDAAARGEWSSAISPEIAASYLQEQLALALTLRADGVPQERVRALFELAVSVLR